jgi:hypothetical protein
MGAPVYVDDRACPLPIHRSRRLGCLGVADERACHPRLADPASSEFNGNMHANLLQLIQYDDYPPSGDRWRYRGGEGYGYGRRRYGEGEGEAMAVEGMAMVVMRTPGVCGSYGAPNTPAAADYAAYQRGAKEGGRACLFGRGEVSASADRATPARN